VILVIMSVSSFITDVILYLQTGSLYNEK
jgi:hypothetical protein